MGSIETELRQRLAALIVAMGYEFVGCELQRAGRHSVLRVYIDSKGGITLADCTKVSHQISALLDVNDPIHGHYHLEVSSPGLDRPLFEPIQYQKVIGSRIKVKMHGSINSQRNFVGMLHEVSETDICTLVNTEKVVLPFSGIEKARVIAD